MYICTIPGQTPFSWDKGNVCSYCNVLMLNARGILPYSLSGKQTPGLYTGKEEDLGALRNLGSYKYVTYNHNPTAVQSLGLVYSHFQVPGKQSQPLLLFL